MATYPHTIYFMAIYLQIFQPVVIYPQVIHHMVIYRQVIYPMIIHLQVTSSILIYPQVYPMKIYLQVTSSILIYPQVYPMNIYLQAICLYSFILKFIWSSSSYLSYGHLSCFFSLFLMVSKFVGALNLVNHKGLHQD